MIHPLIAQTRIPTPLGPMTAAATAQGIAGLWFDGQRHHPGEFALPRDDDQAHLARLRRELERYWHDPATPFEVPLDPQGTSFQRAVWQALRQIGPGALDGYGAIARRLGRPQAARAVGAAVGRNPIGIVVPCHRVVGSDGALTGYAGGLERKRALLVHEGALSPEADAAWPGGGVPPGRGHARTTATTTAA
jgi:methylated-DNA-[protein]-cysteine S-methyltransferase